MSVPTANETWLINAGGEIILKEARDGIGSLSALEKLIYCLWVADYGMRNAGDLDTAQDVYANFQTEAAQLAQDLNLSSTYSAFALPKGVLEQEYFEHFEDMCDEIRRRGNRSAN